MKNKFPKYLYKIMDKFVVKLKFIYEYDMNEIINNYAVYINDLSKKPEQVHYTPETDTYRIDRKVVFQTELEANKYILRKLKNDISYVEDEIKRLTK